MNPLQRIDYTSFPSLNLSEKLAVNLEKCIFPIQMMACNHKEIPFLSDLNSFRSFPCFDLPKADEFGQIIQDWCIYLSTPLAFCERKLQTYCAWMAHLPSSSEDYWDAIPKDRVQFALIKMSESLEHAYYLNQGCLSMGDSPVIQLASLNYYFIAMRTVELAHRLVKRVCDSQFEGWGIYWDPTFINKVFTGEVFYNHGFFQEKLWNCALYFKQQMKKENKKGMILLDNRPEQTLIFEENFLKKDWHKVQDAEIAALLPIEQQLKFLSQFFKEPCSSASFYKYFTYSVSSSDLTEELRCLREFEKIHANLRLLHSHLGSPPCAPAFQGTIQRSHQPGSFSYQFMAQTTRSNPYLSSKKQAHPECPPLFSSPPKHSVDENSAMVHQHQLSTHVHLSMADKMLYELYALSASYNKSNRMALILNWVKKKTFYLRDPAIQSYLFQLLLSENHISGTYLKKPYVIDNLRDFLSSLIQEFTGGARDRKHLAFWIRVGYLIETRIPDSDTRRGPQILFYQEKVREALKLSDLDDFEEAEFNLLWVLTHSHIRNISIEQGEEMVSCLFRAHKLSRAIESSGDKKSKERIDLHRLEAGSLTLSWNEILADHFGNETDSKEYERILNLLSKTNIRAVGGKGFFGYFPIFSYQRMCIDCTYGQYEDSFVQTTTWQDALQMGSILGVKPDLKANYDAKTGRVESNDGSFRCFRAEPTPDQPLHQLESPLDPIVLKGYASEQNKLGRTHVHVISQKIDYKGCKGAYEYLGIGQCPLPHSLSCCHYRWLSVEKGLKRHILFINKNHLPYAKLVPLENQEGQFVCHLLNKEGFETGEKLVFLII